MLREVRKLTMIIVLCNLLAAAWLSQGDSFFVWMSLLTSTVVSIAVYLLVKADWMYVKEWEKKIGRRVGE